MIEPRLSRRLAPAAKRFRQLRFWQSLTMVWLLAGGLGMALLLVGAKSGLQPSRSLELVAIVALAGACFGAWRARAVGRDPHWVAERIEAEFPELKSCLLTAVEQRPELPGGRYGFLQDRVIRHAIGHADRHAWQDVVPTRRLAFAGLANAGTLLLLAAVMILLGRQAGAPLAASVDGHGAELVEAAGLSFTVEPGNAEVERGTSLLVLARFQGPQPAEATLIYQSADSEPTRLPLAKSLADPVFGGRIAMVEAPLEYRVELGPKTSETYRVTVFEYPKLQRADARLKYPGYTGLEERVIQDVRTVSVVEGTELTLICHLNKRVKSASLVDKEGASISLSAVEGTAADYQATLRCEKTQRLKLQLVDDQGRANKAPAEFAINVLPNQPPDLKFVFPARDIEVSPLEESDVKATAWDDYGLKRLGLTYALAGARPEDVVLAEDAVAKQKHEVGHVIRFEELKAEPDELLSYYFWAEDFGPDGQVRRTQSDMYFAEVRHFEEIFRQGEQPPGGQSQQQQQAGGENAQAAEKLGQLQKDIINATWKLIRREIGDKPSPPFADDAQLIFQSQASALEQATALAEKLQDAESKRHAAAVIKFMEQALEQLTAAKEGPAIKPLEPALSAEQGAYQALLKLRAREHRVIRGRQQQGGAAGGGGNRAQQQMQQLELKNDENRYETQRTAQSQQQQENRETRQVLNRLSELARRQNDLNERLKELQSALEEARTEQEREEIRRQLKRLREEEQQILRDVDELQNRMDSPENQQRMAEARDQLQQTRDQVRRASEALEQEQVSQAAAAGTRAEQDFQTLRNEFRRRTAGQFDEQMRELRDEARKLDERQEKLGATLAGEEPRAEDDKQAKSLRGDNPVDKLPEDLKEQQQLLKNLVEQMRETIQQAESSEPLLSERLYDAARKVQQQNVEQALEAAELSTRRGLQDDARQQEQIARNGIRQLREGVERAAEGVLGDDSEALRQAREQLDRLADELNDEIARNTGQGGDPEDQSEAGPERERTAQQGERQQGEGELQQGESREGGERRARQGRGGEQTADRQEGEQGGEPPSEEGAERESQRGRGNANDQNSQPGRRRSARTGEQSPDAQNREGSPSNQGQETPEGEQPRGNSPGENESQQSEQQQGSQRGEQQGRQQQGGRQQDGRQQGGQQQGGRQQGGGQPGGNQRGGPRNAGNPFGPGGFDAFREAAQRMTAPIGGEDFRDWSDRLRDVEEMVDDPDLRAEAARIRERARDIRRELKRHSLEPNWDLIRVEVSEPLVELRDRVAEELLRRTDKDALIPLDRDPAPPKYLEQTRRYYERLGSGQ